MSGHTHIYTRDHWGQILPIPNYRAFQEGAQKDIKIAKKIDTKVYSIYLKKTEILNVGQELNRISVISLLTGIISLNPAKEVVLNK